MSLPFVEMYEGIGSKQKQSNMLHISSEVGDRKLKEVFGITPQLIFLGSHDNRTKIQSG